MRSRALPVLGVAEMSVVCLSLAPTLQARSDRRVRRDGLITLGEGSLRDSYEEHSVLV